MLTVPRGGESRGSSGPWSGGLQHRRVPHAGEKDDADVRHLLGPRLGTRRVDDPVVGAEEEEEGHREARQLVLTWTALPESTHWGLRLRKAGDYV